VRAFIIGGSGLVGRAVSRRLVGSGWTVDVFGRDPAHFPDELSAAGVRFLAGDRSDSAALSAAFGGGADLLVDCVCFTARHAEALLPLARAASSTAMISSKAVYVDAAGRHSNSEEPPCFVEPVTETQPTLEPGDMDFNSRAGYGPNKVAAERVLLESGLPVSVLRPSKIHGEGARPPREWIFVKRVLDRRPAILLAHRGRGVEHTTAAANVAALVELVAAKPATRILNAADPDAPSGLEIARTVARHLGHTWREVLLDDDAPRELGRHPWDRPCPFTLDTTAAVALGYEPVGDYAATVVEEIDWLVRIAERGDASRGDASRGIGAGGVGGSRVDGVWLPAAYESHLFEGAFDYAAEDAFLAAQ
jgi:nucleoside-diphosphate-sugar epimerase